MRDNDDDWEEALGKLGATLRGEVAPPVRLASTAKTSGPVTSSSAAERAPKRRRRPVLFHSSPRYTLDHDAAAARAARAARAALSAARNAEAASSPDGARSDAKRKRASAQRSYSPSAAARGAPERGHAALFTRMVRSGVIKAGSLVSVRFQIQGNVRMSKAFEGFITSSGVIQRRGSTFSSPLEFAQRCYETKGGPEPTNGGWNVCFVLRKACTLKHVYTEDGRTVGRGDTFISISTIDASRFISISTLSSSEAQHSKGRARRVRGKGLPKVVAARLPVHGGVHQLLQLHQHQYAPHPRSMAQMLGMPQTPSMVQLLASRSIPLQGAPHGGASPASLDEARMMQQAMSNVPRPPPGQYHTGAPAPPPGPAAPLGGGASSIAGSSGALILANADVGQLAGLNDVLTVMLEAFYTRFNPAKVAKARPIAEFYSSDLATLNSELKKAYGFDLDCISGVE